MAELLFCWNLNFKIVLKIVTPRKMKSPCFNDYRRYPAVLRLTPSALLWRGPPKSTNRWHSRSNFQRTTYNYLRLNFCWGVRHCCDRERLITIFHIFKCCDKHLKIKSTYFIQRRSGCWLVKQFEICGFFPDQIFFSPTAIYRRSLYFFSNQRIEIGILT